MTGAQISRANLPVLSATQARVLGTLMEKARTVPDSYPLTLNAVVTGCNQKSSRNPCMEMTEIEALDALNALKSMSAQPEQMLVREVSGSRSQRYEHNFQRSLGVPEQSAVILGILMLRGPQTAGELRINSDRWYKFADISSVEAFLEELQNRSPEKGGALVQKLPRAPGAREQRWAHLLCGEIDVTELETAYEASDLASSEGSKIHQRISALEDEVARLNQILADLCKELGLTGLTAK
ncbi:MAG TPA: YceH family protein [Burkholderiaceae bacterium]|nr:YceH family protein [Burkholderiaceae bacterium]